MAAPRVRLYNIPCEHYYPYRTGMIIVAIRTVRTMRVAANDGHTRRVRWWRTGHEKSVAHTRIYTYTFYTAAHGRIERAH
jgi:hypothetical protein